MTNVINLRWGEISVKYPKQVKDLQHIFFSMQGELPNKYILIGAYAKFCNDHRATDWIHVTEFTVSKFIEWLDEINEDIKDFK